MLASADTWDLNLGRLCWLQNADGSRLDCGRAYTDEELSGLTADPVMPDHESFRSLMSELGVIFAPPTTSPAETVGFAGFNFSVETSFVSVNSRRSSNRDDLKSRHRFWRAADSVSDETFGLGSSIYESGVDDRIDAELPPNTAKTITLMARKGFWFPLPSMELGFGVRHLFDSSMWAAMLTAKIALHEGFQGWVLPSFALRGAVSRVFGTSDFDLTIAGGDVSVSKAFGIASTVTLTPYAGYQVLWIIADSGTIDALPNQPTSDLTSDRHFTFLDRGSIARHSVFLGVRANVNIAMLLLQFSYYAAGSDRDEIAIPTRTRLEVDDESGNQFAFNLSIGVDF